MQEIKIKDGAELLKRNFITYARDVNANRAFPKLVSGIKPVAGRILWSMWYNNRKHNKPFTKSAKIEGEVMSFNPHSGSYIAMVRMAQDFIYHLPLIEGHGSFGSTIGGPSPGAARYTSMRLSEFSEDVFFYNTKLLDMGLNYLEEDPEPILDSWVSLLPILYITNTSGIGYTEANNWSSGNLFEFRDQLLNYLQTGKVDCSKLYPDFPSGGVIINKSELKDIYETGNGTVKLRGNIEVDGDTINITSLPFQIYPEDFIEGIKKLGEKTSLDTITSIKNLCGKDKFLIEIKCKKDTAKYTVELLCNKTDLQINISNNRKAITESGKPETVTMLDYMKSFVDSNINLVIKEAEYNLDIINARLEIVNGLLSALDIIDEIIALIKSSANQNEAKERLTKKYVFTENQAQAIVSTTLGKLANLEHIKLQEEKEELDRKKEENENLKSSYEEQEKYFLARFNKLVDKYGWERKTKVIDYEPPVEIKETKQKIRENRPKKEYIIVLTENNCLKRIELTKFKQTVEDEKTIKVKQDEKVVLVADDGMMYKITPNKIDKCLATAAGMDIASLGIEGNIINIYSNNKLTGKEDFNLNFAFFVTSNGLGMKSEIKKSLGISKSAGAALMKFKQEGDKLKAIKLVNNGDNIKITTNKREINILTDDVRASGRGASGKVLFKLKDEEIIENVESIKK